MDKRAVNFLLLIWLTGLSVVSRAANEEPTVKDKLGLDEVRCPMKHARIRAVPILYGLYDLSDELKEKVDKKEVILGGCSISPESPAYQGLCQECGLEYDPWLELWSRNGTTTSTFSPPLDDMFKSFPVPPGARHRFYQSFRGGKISTQRMSFDQENKTTASLQQLVQVTEEWLRENKINTTDDPEYLSLFKDIDRGFFWESETREFRITIESKSPIHKNELHWNFTIDEKNPAEVEFYMHRINAEPNYIIAR